MITQVSSVLSSVTDESAEPLRVMALHALVDDSLDLLAALPVQQAGHDE